MIVGTCIIFSPLDITMPSISPLISDILEVATEHEDAHCRITERISSTFGTLSSHRVGYINATEVWAGRSFIYRYTTWCIELEYLIIVTNLHRESNRTCCSSNAIVVKSSFAEWVCHFIRTFLESTNRLCGNNLVVFLNRNGHIGSIFIKTEDEVLSIIVHLTSVDICYCSRECLIVLHAIAFCQSHDVDGITIYPSHCLDIRSISRHCSRIAITSFFCII